MSGVVNTLPSDSNVYAYGRGSISYNANPVGNPQKPTREMAPVSMSSPPDVLHPKLNRNPWPVSYGQPRSEAMHEKGKRNKRKGGKKK